MTVLVFGATGQVGTELRRAAGVVALSRADVDLGDAEAVIRAVQKHSPGLVINAAAYTAVDRAEDDQAMAFAVNAEAPGAMALATARMGVPLVHISTDYVFEGGGNAPWTEKDRTAPQNVYGASKLAGEDAVRAAGGVHAILRTAWVFSAHGANFVKTMLRLAETRARLTVVNDQVGGPTPAADIAAACLTVGAALKDGHSGGTFHFAGVPHVSWAEFAREIFAQAGRQVEVAGIPTEDYPTPAARPRNSRLDCTRIAAEFGVAAPDWRRGLSAVLKELEAT